MMPWGYHHDVMRTTLTLEEDVARRLKKEMQERGLSFKAAVNAVLRRGFSVRDRQAAIAPFEIVARPLGLREDVDIDCIPDVLERLDGPLYR